MANNSSQSAEAFNIKEFILKALSLKYFYILSFIICVSAAYILNKTSPSIVEVTSVIGPVEDRRYPLAGSNDLFAGFGGFNQGRNLENDINSLNSFRLVGNTLQNMNLEIGYFRESKKYFRRIINQLYQNVPFIVTLDKSHPQPINAKFYIRILDENTYRLTAQEEETSLYNFLDNNVVSYFNVLRVDTVCRFNETISHSMFKFSISLNSDFNINRTEEDQLYYFELYHLDLLTRNYLSRLTVEPVSPRSSLIKLKFQGQNVGLTIDFLNKYVETYLDDNLSKKNKISVNTINFIDSQISEISDSLLVSESMLRDYRSAYQVTDLSYQGQQALQQMTQIENERSALQVQERYYNYVLDYFDKNQDMAGLAPPSVANVADPIMNTLVLELLALNTERSAILSNNAEKNLFLGQIENKLRLQKQAIIENVKNNLNTLNLTQNELNYRAEKVSREISKLPRTELNMVSMKRKFDLSDAIYTFLLQKRSESAITMASNYPDYEILEPARSVTRKYVAPKSNLNLLIGIFLGLMIPTLFIILRDFFNENITSIADAERILNKKVLSIIYTNTYKSETVVYDSPRSHIAESFRNLRSILFMRFKNFPLKVLMVTSAQPRDGKSFVAYNLAASIAAVGNKTIILDCDMRRPTLHTKFNMDNNTGLSNYMANHTALEEIIFSDPQTKNLSFIPAGPLLPNTSELIESGALDELMETLKNEYDYVIIDSTPFGIVADATLLTKYASHILLVCRNNATRKDLFNDVLDLFSINKIENFDVVFNDLNLSKSRYGRYNAYYKKN